MLKMPQGANTDTQTSNKTQPNQDFERNLHKNENPTHFKKIPNLQNPKIKST